MKLSCDDFSFKKNRVFYEKPGFNEIFISKLKRNPEKIYLERGLELFKNPSIDYIYICGLGSCVSLAVKIALKLSDILPNIIIDKMDTFTVTHNDDYINNITKQNERRNDRNSNLIKIKLTKKLEI